MSNTVIGTLMIVIPLCIVFGIGLWTMGWEAFKEVLIGVLAIVVFGVLIGCILLGFSILFSGWMA